MTENLAVRQLPAQEQREYDAVDLAIKRTRLMPDGKLRMDTAKHTIMKGYSIPSAAMALHISERTARRYRWQFILLVGHTYGFLDEEGYCAAIEKDEKKNRTPRAEKMC